MTISEFYKLFPTEASCRTHLKLMRESQGVTCKKCSCAKHYWLAPKEQWQCSKCGFRTTLLSGTLFEASKLKLRIWFQALYLICNTKKGISACELQRQLGLKRNEPAWYMMQKIRKAMAQINEKQQLTGEIEMDDAFFTTIEDPKKQSTNLIQETTKRGRGTTKQKALVMVESMTPTDGTHKGKCGKIRMLKTKAIDMDTVWRMEDQHLRKTTKIRTDGYRSFRILDPHKHEPNVVPSNKADKILPWVHTAIGNAKRLINGIYHHVSSKFAQLYFDEFCFKFNFRFHKVKWNVVFQHALNFNW